MPYSTLDPNIPVDQLNFVVSILRKPNSENPEHAFLMVEAISSFDKLVFRRYDLFIDKDSADRRALIYMKPEVVVDVKDAKTALLEDILRGEEVYSISWSITKQQATALHNDILKDKANPPKYQVSGDASLVAKSSSVEGHSCFTWAREKLHNLEDERIRLPEKYTDFIGAKTSLYIKGANHNSGKCAVM